MTPLTRKQRWKSVIILIFIFILISPVIIFKSLGYSLAEGLSFEKTGGIFVQSDIGDTEVYIDGVYFKSNRLFSKNILIQDLKPNKEYFIEVHKEGYQSWIKNIMVYPSFIYDYKSLMLPKEFNVREIYTKETLPEDTSTTSKKLDSEYENIQELFAVKKNESVSKEIDSSKIFSEELLSFFEEIDVVATSTENLILRNNQVSWLKGGDIYLYWLGDKNSIPYYFCNERNKEECNSKVILNWNDKILRFDYLPQRQDVWVVLTKNGIYAVEVSSIGGQNIQYIYEGKNLDFRLSDNGKIIIKDNNLFYEISL